jgi:leader peptidase (prepilin peptidase)/N-methyltransferase
MTLGKAKRLSLRGKDWKPMTFYSFEIWLFVFGLCIGSFLNVVIHRLPLGVSIVKPRSKCPRCDTPIAFYDNIPILSYLLLRGRCRGCRVPIGIRYPLVELLAGILTVGIFISFGPTATGTVYFVLTMVLIAVTFIDIDHRIIPDIITLPGIPLFFIAALFLPHISIRDALLGIVAGGGSLYLVALGYHLITGQEGMGGGDIKLLAMIGAVIGWQGIIFTIFAGSFIGCAAGFSLMIKNRKGMKLAIPFGPFLSLGAALYLFYGPQLIFWYLNLMRH